jgi:hypothetical protein
MENPRYLTVYLMPARVQTFFRFAPSTFQYWSGKCCDPRLQKLEELCKSAARDASHGRYCRLQAWKVKGSKGEGLGNQF